MGTGRGGPAWWVALAVAAAATAGALALVVTAARLPVWAGLLSPQTFYKALVGHVTFSLVVWLLSCSVAVALHAAGERGEALPGDSWARVAGLGALAMLAGLLSAGRPVVVDYLPYVDSPLYLLGYGLFAAGAAGALWPFARGLAGSGPWGLSVAYVATLVTVGVGLLRAGSDSPQAALWGGGHALQFVYVTALALSWYELAGHRDSRHPLSRMGFVLSGALAWLPALTYFAGDPSVLPSRADLNLVQGLALSLPTLLHLGALVMLRPRPEDRADEVSLRWSVGLYLLGGLLAPVGAANTLQVTAHYHAMLVGGVTTAFMGVVYRILQQQGFPVHTRAARWQVHLFGLGVLLTVAALLVAASAGLPRKAYLGGGHPWQLPFVLLSAAAAFSAAGGVWFLSSAAGALWSSRRAPVGPAVPATSPGR